MDHFIITVKLKPVWRYLRTTLTKGFAYLLLLNVFITQTATYAQGLIVSPRTLDSNAGLSVILLGTGIPIPQPDRASACTGVIAGEKVFLVDTGRNCVSPLRQAGITDLEGIFYTHYHSDHFIGLGEILLNFAVAGLDKSMPVIGPVGAQQVVDGIIATYSLDLKYRVAHHGKKFSEAMMKPAVTELSPGVVYEEDGLRVTMFNVCHQPIDPAVGYRFEYQGKSVVISGDTNICPEFAEGARDADLLVSEVSNVALWNQALALARAIDNQRQVEMIQEGMEYHAESLALAQMAEEIGVKKLALTHFFPSIPPTDQAEAMFTRGMSDHFEGPIIVGRDGMEVAP